MWHMTRPRLYMRAYLTERITCTFRGLCTCVCIYGWLQTGWPVLFSGLCSPPSERRQCSVIPVINPTIMRSINTSQLNEADGANVLYIWYVHCSIASEYIMQTLLKLFTVRFQWTHSTSTTYNVCEYRHAIVVVVPALRFHRIWMLAYRIFSQTHAKLTFRPCPCCTFEVLPAPNSDEFQHTREYNTKR